jgi:glycosyltransferase involved in cell wall biosynthesis
MSETAHEGMLAPFMRYLTACAYATRLAAISDTASLEFRSWRSTLASRGISGPDIETVELATEMAPSGSRAEPAGQAGARSDTPGLAFEGSDVPMVVVVGSHEPRKNHMTVLHAAELLWRRGERFSVLFLGGNSWHSEPFFERVAELRSKGRLVDTVSAAPDHVVSSAYHAAACSVFVSLHEGFGLPIVESLAHATPVITSRYGAMADNARHGGCLLVDPRDPHQVADAISQVINHDDLRRKLRSEASAVPARTWDTYAREAWDFLVHGRPPR